MLDWLKTRRSLLAEISILRESLIGVEMQRDAACRRIKTHEAAEAMAAAQSDRACRQRDALQKDNDRLKAERNTLVQQVNGDRNNKHADLVKARVLLAEIDRLKAQKDRP